MRGQFGGSRSKMVLRSRSSLAVQTKPRGLFSTAVSGLLGAQQAAADFHGVVRADLGGEVGDDAAIDADLAGGDEFLDAAAGAEAGGGEKTIETHGRKK